nr:pab1-binding protein 1 [Quercus suber]
MSVAPYTGGLRRVHRPNRVAPGMDTERSGAMPGRGNPKWGSGTRYTFNKSWEEGQQQISQAQEERDILRKVTFTRFSSVELPGTPVTASSRRSQQTGIRCHECGGDRGRDGNARLLSVVLSLEREGEASRSSSLSAASDSRTTSDRPCEPAPSAAPAAPPRRSPFQDPQAFIISMSATVAGGSDGVKSSSPANLTSSKQPKHNGMGKPFDGGRKQAASPVDGQNKKQQPLKAWQGHNPITQKSSSSNPNGTEKPLPKLPSQPQSQSTVESHADHHSHDRLLFLLANMTVLMQIKGRDVTLTLKNGERFTGIFSGGSFEPSARNQYVMRMVKRTESLSHQQPNGTTEASDGYIGEGEDYVMSFDVQDTIDLSAKDIITTTAQSTQNGSASFFRTDAEISGRDPRMPRERELQRWEPSEDVSLDMTLESSGASGWDQFAANQKLYGVESTYDEDIYTTQINRNGPQYKQREAIAAKLAREIEGSTPSNAHVAEERIQDADRADGLDEEDKYSGVMREAVGLPRRGAGSYIPPSQRPITNAPTVSGAPYDPAIISSQLAKPSTPSVATGSTTRDMTTASKPETKEIAPDETVSATPATDQGKKPMKNTTEDHVRATTDAFKQFANTEKLRIKAAQEAKKSTARHEKNVKLNDLKKFAANFKLNSRVPDDLVPILAKDREKQVEIQRKADEAALLQEQKGKEKEKEKVITTPAETTAVSLSGPAGPASEARAPMNQNRNRVSGQMRNPTFPAQNQAPHASLGQKLQQNVHQRGNMAITEPSQNNFQARMPPGAAGQTARSPSAAPRMNVKAKPFEFRPGVGDFTPSGTSPSPQRFPIKNTEPTITFFGKTKSVEAAKTRKDLDDAASVVIWMLSAEWPEAFKRDIAGNGGVPPPWRTDPTWPIGENVSYKDHKDFKTQAAGQSPMHAHNHSAIMTHGHSAPAGMPVQHIPVPGRGPYINHQQHPGQGSHFDPRMSQFAPNGSVHGSPRFQGAQVAPFNGQIPQMQMPQFGGQPMPGYHMSPSTQHRQMQMPPGGQMMMLPNQQYGQGKKSLLSQSLHD